MSTSPANSPGREQSIICNAGPNAMLTGKRRARADGKVREARRGGNDRLRPHGRRSRHAARDVAGPITLSAPQMSLLVLGPRANFSRVMLSSHTIKKLRRRNA